MNQIKRFRKQSWILTNKIKPIFEGSNIIISLQLTLVGKYGTVFWVPN